MKNFLEDALIPLAFLLLISLTLLLGFGTEVYGKYLDSYNTQKDREMFLKSYEIVLECRKSYGVSNSANNICGEIPTFFSEVK